MTRTPWYRLTPFQLAVIEAWERGDVRALVALADYRRCALGMGAGV